MRKVLFLLPVLVAGCEARAELPNNPVPPVPVDLREADFATVDAAIAANKGRVVLVDMWATWCGPCVKTFPEFVALHTKYAPHGLACVSVSLDRQRDAGTALAKLKGWGATFPNFVLTNADRDESKIVARFGYDDAIPHKALFDKTGKRVWDSATDSRSGLARRIETELLK